MGERRDLDNVRKGQNKAEKAGGSIKNEVTLL